MAPLEGICADGAKQVPSESKGRGVRNRVESDSRAAITILLFCLSLFLYCDTQRNYSAETRSATYPSHPTMQHAATPQQLLLGWNCCQSTSISMGAHAVLSAIKTTNAVVVAEEGEVFKKIHDIQIARKKFCKDGGMIYVKMKLS